MLMYAVARIFTRVGGTMNETTSIMSMSSQLRNAKDTLTADLTFHANGTVATTWDDIAQFRGVSEGDVTRFAIAKPEPLRVEHENFRDAVLGKESDIVTLEQGAQVVRVCEAMIESASSNAFVDVR